MPTTLSTLFGQFCRERQHLHNVTSKTLIWYECSWVAFTRHIDPNLPVGQLTEPMLKDAAVGMREAGLKPVSINTYLRCINAWLRWMHQEGHVPERMKVTGPKTEQRVLPVLTSDQIRRI
jgi:site-specific recombinase XerD